MKTWQEVEGLFYGEEEGHLLQKYANGKRCLEIGSYKGKSAVAMAEIADAVFCIDTFKGHEVGAQLQLEEFTTLQDFNENTKGYNNIFVYQGLSGDILPQLSEQYDFIFIDGWHEKDGAMSDIISCIRLCHDDSHIAIHDCWEGPHIGVKMATDELFKGRPVEICRSIGVYSRRQYAR